MFEEDSNRRGVGKQVEGGTLTPPASTTGMEKQQEEHKRQQSAPSSNQAMKRKGRGKMREIKNIILR